jgi:hypothetical protein
MTSSCSGGSGQPFSHFVLALLKDVLDYADRPGVVVIDETAVIPHALHDV